MLTPLCSKLNKFFTDGKQIKTVLEQQPQVGKQALVQARLATVAQFAVRDWILPFMMHFTDLLKVLWTLWEQNKRKMKHGDSARRALEQLASIVGRCVVAQLGEEVAARGGGAPPKDSAPGGRRAGDSAPAEPVTAPVSALAGITLGSPSRGGGGGAIGADVHSNGLGPTDAGASGWAAIVARPASELPMMPASLASKPAGPAPAAAKPRISAGGATDEAVRALVSKREQARFARDFESADRLRDQLGKLGVTLDDQSKVWRAADGRSGPITAVNISELHAQKAAKAGAAALSDDEIDRLVKEREQARFTSDYKTADRLREQLEKHGVHLDTKTNKWQSADGRSGPIGPVNISAAHAQRAARAGARTLPVDEIEKILVQREQARARRDYKTADTLRDQLEKHGVYLDAKENKWHSADGRTGPAAPTSRAPRPAAAGGAVSALSDDEIHKILAARQAARLRHDYKSADRLRDQLNEQCVSVDDKKNRWDAADGRSGNIEPFTCVHPPPAEAPPAAAALPAANGAKADDAGPLGSAVAAAAAAAKAAGADAKGDSKRVLPEKARRELAKKLREITGASARLCEKALQSHSDDMERAADWLLNERDAGRDADTNGA